MTQYGYSDEPRVEAIADIKADCYIPVAIRATSLK